MILIVKTITITYIEDDLVIVFEDYKLANEVFDGVSAKYDTKTTTHIQVLVQPLHIYKY